MLRVGIVGIGFMGWIHWLAYQKNANAKVVAICETDPTKRSGDWTAIQGNFGPQGEKVDLSDIAVYENADDLFSDTNVDLVDICLPPALHCPLTLQAFEHGKDVFCEKPMALKLDDCDRMLEAASQSNKKLMIGHVLPFFPEYSHAREIISSGAYGSLLGGHFKRVISDPTWLNHFYDPEKIGGPLLDLHVHDAHFIRMLFGMPSSVGSTGRRRDGTVDFCSSIYQFPDSHFAVSSTMGVINQQGRPFTHGYEIHLEKATLQFEFAGFSDEPELMPLKVLTHDDQVLRPELGDGDPVNAFVNEIEEVVDCLQNNRNSEILEGQLARDAIEICQMQDKEVQ